MADKCPHCKSDRDVHDVFQHLQCRRCGLHFANPRLSAPFKPWPTPAGQAESEEHDRPKSAEDRQWDIDLADAELGAKARAIAEANGLVLNGEPTFSAVNGNSCAPRTVLYLALPVRSPGPAPKTNAELVKNLREALATGRDVALWAEALCKALEAKP